VRALAALQRDGLVDQIGLCNVTVGQIEEARSLAEIASVQVELSLWNDANVLAFGARLIGSDMAKACVLAFLDTDFAGGRHQRRVNELSNLLEESD